MCARVMVVWWCIGVVVCWCSSVLVYIVEVFMLCWCGVCWCCVVVVGWCSGVLMWWCIGVVVCWCNSVFVWWVIYVVLVCWLCVVMVQWCGGALVCHQGSHSPYNNTNSPQMSETCHTTSLERTPFCNVRHDSSRYICNR